MILLHLKIGARARWPLAVGLTLAGWAVFYSLFQLLLSIPFPPGLPTNTD
jgi:hypothetical protein